MFDLGIQELIVIFIVALLVFGPKKLPEIGRTLGRGMNELKRAMQGVKEQMDSEMHQITESEGLKELKEIKESVALGSIITPEQQNGAHKESSEETSQMEHTPADSEAASCDSSDDKSSDFASGYGDMEPEEKPAPTETAQDKTETPQKKSDKGTEGAA